jgi:hypothetical protein
MSIIGIRCATYYDRHGSPAYPIMIYITPALNTIGCTCIQEDNPTVGSSGKHNTGMLLEYNEYVYVDMCIVNLIHLHEAIERNI